MYLASCPFCLFCFLFICLLSRSVVETCNSIHLTRLDSKVSTIRWASDNPQIVHVLTEGSKLYRSTDEGRTFINIMANIPNSATTYSPYGNAGIRQLYPTSDPNKMYLLGYGPVIWTTRDKGVTFTFKNLQKTVLNLLVHPNNPDIALAYSYTSRCFGLFASGNCFSELLVTENFGQDWRVIDTYFMLAFWGDPTVQTRNSLFYLAFADKTGDMSVKPTNQLSCFHTYNFGIDKTLLIDHTVGLLYSPGSILWIATQNTSSLNLYVSLNEGETLTLTQFPEDLSEKRYTILDTSEKSTFVNVDHSSDNSWGNLYMSDAADVKYSLSLRRQKRVNGLVDFMRLMGLEGIYITNYYDDLSDTPGSDKVSTLITYDKGALWSPITNVTRFSASSCSGPNCRLNLFGRTDTTYEAFYSDPTAVGLIIANGNWGNYRSYERISTFFSRDAGWSWKEIAIGVHVFEFGDHGSITVTASSGFTDTVMYSWDQGETWSSCAFTSTSDMMFVTNIVGEPSSASPNFMVYGEFSNGDGGIFFLDFSNSVRECIGWETPDSPSSDYERWSPNSVVGRNCLMGQTFVYTRRKHSSLCSNPLSETVNPATSCPCTDLDYQCDFCFEARMGTDQCEITCDGFNVVPPNCTKSYLKTQGYQLVPGNKCDYNSGINKLPILTSCPTVSSSKSPIRSKLQTKSGNPLASRSPASEPKKNESLFVAFLLFVVFATLVAVSGLLLYLFRTNPRFRTLALNYLPDSFKADQSPLYRPLDLETFTEDNSLTDENVLVDDTPETNERKD